MSGIEAELADLTNRILEKFYQREPALLLANLHPEVLFIGMPDGRLCSGKEKVREVLEKREGFLFQFTGFSQEKVYSAKEFCLVTGYFSVKNRRDGNEESENECCGTFLWQNCGGEWRIRHIHISPVCGLKSRSIYLGQIHIRNCESMDIYIAEKDIYYIEAIDGVVTFYLRDKEPVYSRENMKSLEERLPEQFVRIHRSYIVNSIFVERVKRYRILLNNGKELPIPEKKYNEVKDRLKKEKDI